MMVVVVTGCFNVWHFDVAVRNFDRSLINAPGPCVLFATPGMISGGFSLQVFKQWAPYEENLVTLPGYLRCYFAYRLSLVSDGGFFFVILWVKTKETVCFIHTPASCWVWRVQVSYQLLALAFKLAFQIQLLDKARLNVGKLNLRLL